MPSLGIIFPTSAIYIRVQGSRLKREAGLVVDRQMREDVLIETVRAAEYVRMSTEHQRYSTENQSAAIRDYASRRKIEIVRSYCDSGKSGLTLDGRPALQQLLADVQSRTTDYDLVLVYDVSRWGRFQDIDESAHYEFVCRSAGIAVHYCAEQFHNDGSPLSAVVKSLKRAMAGEYSRELSQKSFAGQMRIVQLGFYIGGRPGYGLRRQLCDGRGSPKAVLEHGERKSIQTDRTILVPGPSQEVEVVRWIFDVFSSGKMHEGQIACVLNERGLVTSKGAPWSYNFVHRILTNERYIGVSTWNLNSYKLKGQRARNVADQVIRKEGAWKPIIDQALFDAVQEIIKRREWHRTREGMIELLQQLHKEHGPLSFTLIVEKLGTAVAWRCQREFGSFTLAFEAAGVPGEKDRRFVRINRELRSVRTRVVTLIMTGVAQRGGQATIEGRFLRINDEFTVAVSPMRCIVGPRENLWLRYAGADCAADIFVAVRANPDKRSIRDFCIIPRHEVPRRLALSQCRDRLLDCYRFDDLQVLFDLTTRFNQPATS